MTKKIQVDYRIAEEVVDPNDIVGGLRLSINGNRVNQFQDEDSYEAFFDWEPQYIGEYLHSDFKRLVDAAYQIAAGNADIYEQLTVRFEPNTPYFIIEPVSSQKIRLAYRNQLSDEAPIAAPRSACGHVVGRSEFCRAVSEAAHKYVEELRSMPLEWGMESLSEFERSLSNLDSEMASAE